MLSTRQDVSSLNFNAEELRLLRVSMMFYDEKPTFLPQLFPSMNI